MVYDFNNVFAQILSGKSKSEKIYEDEHLLVIKNIAPAADIHWLILPKETYIDFNDFTSNASVDTVSNYFKMITKITKNHNISHYRIVINNGLEAGQTIFHFHTHIISGIENSIKDNKLIDHNL